MTTPHNRAAPGDYAPAVLLPGDPMRAKWIAERFLEDAVLVNDVRGCFGYTGTYKSARVSVQASGMGQPSLGIYAHELIQTYGAKKLIRVGTCGGLGGKVKVRDIVAAQAACTDSSTVTGAFGNYGFAPVADFGLLVTAATEAARLGVNNLHVGNILSSDIFYHEDGFEGYRRLKEHGVLAVEMEAAVLYMLAARHRVSALALCAVSDCLETRSELSPSERQSDLVRLAELALETAVAAD
ncbi:purine-nucleoside phosphorylase [Sinorhizobium meliloti]|nr:purine-nucleoside phosphorylase [Sinorhizobium meliloti]